MKTQVVTARPNGLFPPTVLGHTPAFPTSTPGRPSPLSVSPALERPRRPVLGPLDLSSAQGHRAAAPMSALASARMINDLRVVPYPKTIKAPNPALNISVMLGKLRYDRQFLIQFMGVCKEKPDSLPPLDTIGLEPDKLFGQLTWRTPPRRINGHGIAKGGGFAMGRFQPPSRGMGSQSPSDASNNPCDARPFTGPAGNRLTPMTRITAQGRVGGGGPREAKRTRAQRGKNRSESEMSGSGFQALPQQLAGMNLEPVAPLEVSENRWVAGSTQRRPQQIEEVQLIERKVTALLNKLTMDMFDSISDQIIAYANRSEQEKDGSTLIQVIRLMFNSAKEDARFSEMYARLCRKMMERLSPDIQDHGIRGSDGRPISGGMLFRKYLLNQCQEDFERGWCAKEAALAATSSKKNGQKPSELEKEGHTETMLCSDEHYDAAKAKLQTLALVQFMGEMFKLSILTERIMHECIKKLLSNVVNPEEADIESLCKLLMVLGQTPDKPKARNHMDIYFERMNEMAKGNNVNYRMKFMLLDVIELRSRHWQARSTMKLLLPISRRQDQGNHNLQLGGSRRGESRDTTEPAGWDLFGGASTRPPIRAGDLCQFSKTSKSSALQFGPSSVFSKKVPKREASLGYAGAVNVFATLGGGALVPIPSSRNPSVDIGPSENPTHPQEA